MVCLLSKLTLEFETLDNSALHLLSITWKSEQPFSYQQQFRNPIQKPRFENDAPSSRLLLREKALASAIGRDGIPWL